MSHEGPKQQHRTWFIPGYAISRHVIRSQITLLLGTDADVRDFTYRGRDGYLVTSTGPCLTTEQIEDLKNLSRQYEEKMAAKMVGKRSISEPVEFNEFTALNGSAKSTGRGGSSWYPSYSPTGSNSYYPHYTGGGSSYYPSYSGGSSGGGYSGGGVGGGGTNGYNNGYGGGIVYSSGYVDQDYMAGPGGGGYGGLDYSNGAGGREQRGRR